MTSLDEASINSMDGTVFAGSGKLAAVCPIPALGSRPRLFVVASWPPVPLPLPWTTWNAHIGPCPMARAGMKWDSVMAKKVPRLLLLPFPRDPPPLFCQTVDISCGVGVVVAQAFFFFFLAPSLGHALGHLVSCRGPCRIACCTATAALALPAVVALTNVDATRRTGGLVEHLELIHKNKSLPVPRPWAQDWAKFSVVSGSGRAHVDSRGSGDRKPGRDGLAWHKYVDTYLTC